MITTAEQAIRVQRERFRSGKKGRSKAVRRWFKRVHGRAVEAHPSSSLPSGLVESLRGNFNNCRGFNEVHL